MLSGSLTKRLTSAGPWPWVPGTRRRHRSEHAAALSAVDPDPWPQAEPRSAGGPGALVTAVRGRTLVAVHGEGALDGPRWVDALLWAAPAIAITLVLGWGHLSDELVTDEGFTVLTTWSLEAFVRSLRADPGMIGYYATLNVWARVVGSSIESLRIVSMMAISLSSVLIVRLVMREKVRPWLAALAALAFVLTPAVRETAIDARPTAFAVLLALAMVYAIGSLERGALHPWRVWLAAALIVASAASHPSVVFMSVAGLVALRVCCPGDRGRIPSFVAGLLLLFPIAALLLLGTGGEAQTSSSEALSQIAGDTLFLGVPLIVCATIAVAITWRTLGNLSWFAGAGVLWVVALVAAHEAGLTASIFARYLVVSVGVLIPAAAVGAGVRGRSVVWSAVLGLMVVGGLLVLADDARENGESPLCTAAEDLADHTRPMDVVEFEARSLRAPIIACLGRGEAVDLLARTHFVPSLNEEDLDNPHFVWNLGTVAPDSPGLGTEDFWVVADSPSPQRVEELRRLGYDCERFGTSERVTQCSR